MVWMTVRWWGTKSLGTMSYEARAIAGSPEAAPQPHTPHNTMAELMRASKRVFLGSLGSRRLNWPALPSRRRLTTAAQGDAASLPLAGIKVLDMTRVLAGVREPYCGLVNMAMF